MEIHHPEKPIHSKKDFIVHMLTVVLGILLALGFEAVVQWGHHRALVREARENIAAEIENNRKALSDGLPEIQQRKKNLEAILAYLQMMESGKSREGSLSYRWAGFDLYSTAWKTAESSGATAYMKYDDLKTYTELYDLQQVFQTFQNDAFHGLVEMSPLPMVLGKDVKKVSPDMIRQMEVAVSHAMQINEVVENAATQLKKQYEDFQKHQ